VGPAAESAVEVDLLSPDLVAHVAPESPFVPVLIQGVARFRAGGADVADLAVAVNGTVAAVTSVAARGERCRKWSVLVREEDLRPGTNRVEVFEVEASGGGEPRLARTPGRQGAPAGAFALRKPGGAREEVVTPEGRAYPVVAGAVRGHLDVVHQENDCVGFAGWASDVRDGRQPECVVVFADGEYLTSGRTGVPRPDVARELGGAAMGGAGFNFNLPPERIRPGDAARLRFFALSSRGEASELAYPRWYRQRDGRILRR
jgi:hypothetical protein